jgi:peptidoglycan/LPS O-acetylase OafA/YrhL
MTGAKPASLPGVRLPGLEAMRWVAALCVLMLHTPVIYGNLPRVFAKGYLGVDLFFILSGYVMEKSFESRPPTSQPVGKFILVRYWRMWPMMALGGIIGLHLLRLRAPSLALFLPIAAANLLLIPVSFHREAYPLDVPAWTIIFILLGNLLHRLLLYRLRGLALVVAIGVSGAAMMAAAIHAGSFDVGSRPENMLLAVPRLLLGYLIGIAMRQAWGDSSPLPIPPALALIALPLLLFGAWRCGWTSWLFDLGFVAIACPLMIAGAIRLRGYDRLASFAGAWSFPLYAIHFPVLIQLRNAHVVYWQAALIALALSALATGLDMLARHVWRTFRARLITL